ncbi:MAG: hypothetical protein CFH01_00478 [Alphaproteobacteria bacterium MarineAlpha2_Bin1]|nr:MAG: hypothetical protein CFH01_00478 [Alphaproteobacteria bacterium MarineAlpha2_Bin1]
MKAYLIGFSSRSDKNPSWIDIYSSIASDILKKYEGKVLLFGKPERILSGDDWERLTIIEFPSIEKLKGFHKDPEYSKVKELRIENTNGEMYFIT